MDPIFPQPGRITPTSLPALLPMSMAAATPVPTTSEQDRMSRIAALGQEDATAGLLWLAMNFPAVCDAMLVKAEFDDVDDDYPCQEPEPYCVKCGAPVGIFLAHGKEYRHYHGVLSPTSKPKPYKADHAPVVGWRSVAPATAG